MWINATANSTNAIQPVMVEMVDECGTSLIDQTYVKYPIMFIYITVFAVCLIGNLLTLIVILTHPRMKTPTNFFLGNLAAVDFLVAIFCIIQNMIHIVGFDHGNWPLGEPLCKIYLAGIHMVPCTSVGILVCVSIEKYIAVLHPFSALQILTKQMRYTVAVCIWIGSALISSPFFFYARMYTFGEHNACTRQPMPYWITFSFIVWYLIPVMILAYIYSRIGKLLWTTGSAQTSTRQSTESQCSAGNSWQMANGRIVVYKQESLLQVPEKDRQRDTKKPKDIEGRRKVVRLLFAVVLAFSVLTLPHHARLLHSSWSTSPICTSHWTSLLQPFSYIFLFVSSAINPILYAFLSKRFRNAVSDTIHCRSGIFILITRSRNRTLVSDVPLEDSRCPSPQPVIRMHQIR